MSLKPLLGTLVIVLSVAACRLASDGLLGVSAPGVAAGIVLTSVKAAGGHVTHSTLTIDSATARYESVICTGGVTGTCDEIDRRTGDVPIETIIRLFETAQSRDFRMLDTHYRQVEDVVPPDGGSTSLMVTVSERQKAITWGGQATVPEVLSRYVCWVNSLRGSLALCY